MLSGTVLSIDIPQNLLNEMRSAPFLQLIYHSSHTMFVITTFKIKSIENSYPGHQHFGPFYNTLILFSIPLANQTIELLAQIMGF